MSDQELGAHYLETVKDRFRHTKALADRAVAQLLDEQLRAEPTPGSNSIAVTMRHIAGNQRSRWTDFLTTDGEKAWRDRDTEFADGDRTRAEILAHWEEGWRTLFEALDALGPDDLQKTVTIRSKPCSAMVAIERQMAHYGYHVGQIVYVARMLLGDGWRTLSVPKGGSDAYNRDMGHDTTS